MTKLERLLRGDKATFEGKEIIKFIDVGKEDSEGDRYIFIILDEYGLFDIRYYDEEREISSIEFTEPEKPRTIEDGLKEGDIIVKKDTGSKRLILGICGSAMIVSNNDNFRKVFTVFTAEELINHGYKILQPEQPKPSKKMTVAEVSKLVGQTVEITE